MAVHQLLTELEDKSLQLEGTHRNRECEPRAHAHLALDPDPPTVELHELPTQGEPQPRPFHLPRRCPHLTELFEHRLLVRLLGWCGLVLVLGACAVANTPQQELAYARWAQCSALPGRLERIDLDGRITFRYTSPSGRQEMLQCLADAGRAGPPLPEAVGVGLGGGP